MAFTLTYPGYPTKLAMKRIAWTRQLQRDRAFNALKMLGQGIDWAQGSKGSRGSVRSTDMDFFERLVRTISTFSSRNRSEGAEYLGS